MNATRVITQITRRRLLTFGSAVAATNILGCGGGGGTNSEGSGGASTKTLTLEKFQNAVGTASAVLKNEAGSSVALWTDPNTGAITQAFYNSNTEAKRIFYGNDGVILRIIDEKSGYFLSSNIVSNERTDYNLYDSTGAWQDGFAVIKNSDGTYSAAKIISSAGLSGQQINGELSGSMVASFSLLSDGLSGIGNLAPITKTSSDLAYSRISNNQISIAILDRLTDIFMSSAHAQTVSGSTFLQAVAGAAVVVAGAAIVAEATTIAIGLVGVAVLGAGVLIAADAIFQHNNTNIKEVINGVLGVAVDNFRQNQNPSTISSTLRNYVDNGSTSLASLNPLSSLISGISSTASTAASTLQAASQAAWQQITSSPPVGTTGLNGVMVDSSGTATRLTGSYNPTNNNYTFSGRTNNQQISGNGTVGGSGSYTASTNGTNSNGSVSTTNQPIGTFNTQQSSGGQGTFSKSYNLVKNSGTFTLTYDMYGIPDKLEVIGADGAMLYSTGGLVSGGNSIDISYSGGPLIFVVLSAPNQGTGWEYSIGAPT